MRIDSSLPLTSIYNPISQPASQDTVEEPTSKELQPSQTMSSASTEESTNKPINLEADTVIDLGKLNGKPFKMLIRSWGGINWSGSIDLNKNEDIIGSPKLELVNRASSAFTRAEHEQAHRTNQIISDLYLITRKGDSVKSINGVLRELGLSQGDIEDVLKRLGVDASKPFTINGRSFSSANGQLSEISTSMQPSQTMSLANTEQNTNKQVSLADDPELKAFLDSLDGGSSKKAIFSKGDYHWNGNIDLTFMPDKTDKPSTEKQRRAARAIEAYSKTEHEWAERSLSIINYSTLLPVEGSQQSSSTRPHSSKA